jgi:haloalkane dehalogenase
MQSAEDLDIGRAVAAGCRRRLTAAEQDAYRAPFPDDTFKAGPRALPGLVPVTPQDPQTQANRAAWRELSRWERPVAVAFSDSDPITGPMADVFTAVVPGTRGCVYPPMPGGHFLQEDAGPTLAAHILDFIERSPG